jgi:Fe2+ transport system protein B
VANTTEEEKGPETKDIPTFRGRDWPGLRAAIGAKDSALLEAKQLSSGLSSEELKHDAEEREHNRNQNFRDHFEKLVTWGMNGAFIAIMVMGAVWVWHLVTPTWLQWMSEQQLDHIQSMVTGGVIAVVVGEHFKRRLGG